MNTPTQSLEMFNLFLDGEPRPFSARQIWDMANEGSVTAETLVQAFGGEDWLPLSTYPELMPRKTVPAKNVLRPPSRVSEVPKTASPSTAGRDPIERISQCLMSSAFFFLILGIITGTLGVALGVGFGLWELGLAVGSGPISLAVIFGVVGYNLK